MVNRGFISLVVFGIIAAHLGAQQAPVDFRNFTFAFPEGESNAVPDEMKWMDLKVKSTITLANGRYDFNHKDPAAGRSILLDRVLYGYLTSAAHLDAVVVLGYHTGGTAYWDYVYAFSLTSDKPKLVSGWLTGLFRFA